jgi:hypothetical protein
MEDVAHTTWFRLNMHNFPSRTPYGNITLAWMSKWNLLSMRIMFSQDICGRLVRPNTRASKIFFSIGNKGMFVGPEMQYRNIFNINDAPKGNCLGQFTVSAV